MAGLAADIQFRNASVVAIFDTIKIFLDIGTVAVGTHTIPILSAFSPVYPLSGLSL